MLGPLHFNPLLLYHNPIPKRFVLKKLFSHRHPGGNSLIKLNYSLGQARPETSEQGFQEQNKQHKQLKPTLRQRQEGWAP